jgi:hypothetical protein
MALVVAFFWFTGEVPVHQEDHGEAPAVPQLRVLCELTFQVHSHMIKTNGFGWSASNRS